MKRIICTLIVICIAYAVLTSTACKAEIVGGNVSRNNARGAYSYIGSSSNNASSSSGRVAGTSVSRPNMSGGYDYYDSSGNKTGSSSKRTGVDGYEYYDKSGN
ncbi:MAG: hypothetical protein HQ558_01065, partial [Candidatus Omnitrophica bacterium]|nr:hypothetical protein [Candidatus Omnitrophota bacterium]